MEQPGKAGASQPCVPLTVDVQHHLPHGWSHRLMEAEPDLSASTQRVVVALRGRKEGAPHWCVPATTRSPALVQPTGPGWCQDALPALPLNPSPNRQVTHSLHGRQVAEDHVHGVNRVGADGLLQVCRLSSSVSGQDLVKQVPADLRHELDGDLEGAVLPTVPRQRHVQINLRTRAG